MLRLDRRGRRRRPGPAFNTINIGFNAVADLLAGRVAGATAFWNDEGVTLERRKPGFHVFRVDDYGAPSYPELVVCATQREPEGRSRHGRGRW